MQRATGSPARNLDGTGRALVVTGVLLIESLTILFAVAAGWFISYFSDDSPERGLAALLDVWPVWVVAVVFIVVVTVALARVARGGSVALGLGGLAGLVIAGATFWILWTGSHEAFRAMLLGAGLVGGLALAAGAAARLSARFE